MKTKNLLLTDHIATWLVLCSGCSTFFDSGYSNSSLDMPSTDSERSDLEFLTRSYETEGYDPSTARVKALQAWNRNRKGNEDEEDDSIRTFPKTSKEKREVAQLAEKYEARGYAPATARGKALDAWRSQTVIRSGKVTIITR